MQETNMPHEAIEQDQVTTLVADIIVSIDQN